MRADISIFYVCAESFTGKTTFFVACAKKTKDCAAEHYLEALKFVFFTATK